MRVLIDANVLASRTLLDWLYHLGKPEYSPLTLLSSEDLRAEAACALRGRHPFWPSSAIDQALITYEEVTRLTEFQSGGYGFTGSDLDDAHVHAAAVASIADVLLTSNRPSDFSADHASEPYRIMTPDAFFASLALSHPDVIARALDGQLMYYRKIDRPVSGMADALRRAGCPQFADIVSEKLVKRG